MNKEKWDTAYFCVNCDERLTEYQKYLCYGRCLHCGYKRFHANSPWVEVYEKAWRFVSPRQLITPWWKFWDRQFLIEYK